MRQKKLKIALLHREDDIYALQRINFLLKSGHEIYSIILPGKEMHLFSDKRICSLYLKKSYLSYSFLKRLIYKKQIDRILLDIEPDVFHVVNALNLYYCKSRIARITVLENQGSDVILSPKFYLPLRLFYRLYYKYVDGVLQDSEIAYLSGTRWGAPKERERNTIINAGINFEIFNDHVEKDIIRKRYNIFNRPIIFCSRNFGKVYNIDTVIHSLKIVKEMIPDVIYIFANNHGILEIKLKRFLERNNLQQNVIFCGYVDHEKEMKYYYRDANVVISVPSSDSSPASVYESMACMTPNIVTDLPWLYSKFIPEKHLITCPVRDAEKLADRILRVLNGHHKLDLDSAYNIVYEQINLQKENAKLEMFYKFLLNDR